MRVVNIRTGASYDVLIARPSKWGNEMPAGDTSERFFHKEDLIAAAVECYRTLFPEAKLLIEGDPTTLEPQLILDGPFDLAVKINSIVDECNEMPAGV